MRSANTVALGSLVGGVLVLGLKLVAWRVTGSVALYSDALESIVNVAAAVAMLVAVRVASKPPDEDHPFGHEKAEYFSAVLEGALIVFAAAAIVREAVSRLLLPQPLAQISVGLAVSAGASAINAGLAAWLVHAGKRLRSPALRADGIHLWTDVATSAGVAAGIALAWFTRVWLLDPLLAILVAVNVLRVGYGLVRESIGGLMDEAVMADDARAIREAIDAQLEASTSVTAIKTRRAGARTFIEVTLHVPPEMTVGRSHELCDRIEAAVERALSGARVTVHVEPNG